MAHYSEAMVCSHRKKYKYIKRDRVFPPSSEPSCSSADGAASSSQSSAGSSKPLSNMKFAVIGKTVKKKGDLTKVVSELGGSIVTTIDSNVVACISTEGKRLLLD